jgi:phosphoribosylanthranilate isomerase
MKVKICGIASVEEARAVVSAGADALGFVFAESPRRVTPEQAHEILRALGSTACTVVGVFVDEKPDRMIDIARYVGFGVMQLHGSEPAGLVEELCALDFDVVKSLRVSAGKDITRALAAYKPTAFLLDTHVSGKAGGTGKTFDWKVAVDAKKFGRVILSGGLGVDNVLDAIRVASPYGVDASTRLETKPGVKDLAKVREFVKLVKSVAAPGEKKSERWPR